MNFTILYLGHTVLVYPIAVTQEGNLSITKARITMQLSSYTCVVCGTLKTVTMSCFLNTCEKMTLQPMLIYYRHNNCEIDSLGVQH